MLISQSTQCWQMHHFINKSSNVFFDEDNNNRKFHPHLYVPGFANKRDFKHTQ
jgi:hypothetical protein